MQIKEKIIETLRLAAPGLKELQGTYYIITAAAMILSGVPIQDTDDIDILVNREDEELLQRLWGGRLMKHNYSENGLFNSLVHRYHFPQIDIEVIADLQICKQQCWLPVKVREYCRMSIEEGLSVNVPTHAEQERMLRLFGRQKDKKRLQLFFRH